MEGRKKRIFLLKGLPLVFIAVFTIVIITIMVKLDFFTYDEISVFLLFFLLIGLLGLVFRLYRKAIRELAENSEAKAPLPWPVRFDLFKSLQKVAGPTYDSSKAPFLLVIALAVLIAAVEILDMLLLQLLPPLPIYLEALTDAVILVLLISPALYFIFFRPMFRQFIIRERAEQALQQCNLDLENRVEQRTAQLQAECTERKRAEMGLLEHQKQLRALSSELALVKERERRHIATDLHDNIGQILALTKNKLGLLRASISAEQDIELVEDIKDMVEDSIRYSRALVFELSSPLLDHLPFESALAWLVEDILEKNQIDFHLTIDDTPKLLDDEPRSLFLKAIREMLVNVVKHAKARNVVMSVRTEADDIIAEVKDDGIGFDVPVDFLPSPGRQQFGVFTVNAWLIHLNGHFSIISNPEQGTCATLTVPRRKETMEIGP